MKSELMSLWMIKITSNISVNMFCGIGYNNDGWKCNDIDECFTNNHNCDLNALCSNIDGAFECTCKTGYEGDGQACTYNGHCTAGNRKFIDINS